MDSLATLNKIVSIFLIGAVALFLLASFVQVEIIGPIYQVSIGDYLSGGDWISSSILLATILLLGFSSILGLAIQGLSGPLFRIPIQTEIGVWTSGREPKETALFQRFIMILVAVDVKLLKEVRFWDFMFRSQALSHPRSPQKRGGEPAQGLSAVRDIIEGEGDKVMSADSQHPIPSFARALFFNRVNPEVQQWVLQHYSTFYLATDAACVILLSCGWTLYAGALYVLGYRGAEFEFYLLCIAFVGQFALIVLCLALGVHRYLYTYRAVAREAALAHSIECKEGDCQLGLTMLYEQAPPILSTLDGKKREWHSRKLRERFVPCPNKPVDVEVV